MMTLVQSVHLALRRHSAPSLYRYAPISNKWQGVDQQPSKNRPVRKGLERKANNFVAQWQSEGDRYVSYKNLVKLDSSLTSFTKGRTKAEKMNLLSELTLTYFAR